MHCRRFWVPNGRVPSVDAQRLCIIERDVVHRAVLCHITPRICGPNSVQRDKDVQDRNEEVEETGARATATQNHRVHSGVVLAADGSDPQSLAVAQGRVVEPEDEATRDDTGESVMSEPMDPTAMVVLQADEAHEGEDCSKTSKDLDCDVGPMAVATHQGPCVLCDESRYRTSGKEKHEARVCDHASANRDAT